MSPTASCRACAALLALVLCAASTTSAHANDSETIATCLHDERAADRDGQACVGRVADPCLDEPAGQSTFGMVECARREAKIWDDMLNDEYVRLMGHLNEKAADNVRNAQRAWIEMRDADCRVPYDLFDGGTMAQPIAARCMLDRTAIRALQIRFWRETAQGE
jgi:uncharacterized protein YecT (DUF1311 family)